jgi:hypothetical protein
VRALQLYLPPALPLEWCVIRDFHAIAMLLLLSLGFISTITGVSSVPVSVTRGASHYTHWQSEPNTRGTFRLLISCLITLTLCVWTAVHLNVPVRKPVERSRRRGRRLRSNYWLRRARWVFLGLVAPELVVYTAWRQWSSARAMTRDLRKSSKVRDTDFGLHFVRSYD